jgi:hypothetical protein
MNCREFGLQGDCQGRMHFHIHPVIAFLIVIIADLLSTFLFFHSKFFRYILLILFSVLCRLAVFLINSSC